MGLPCRPGPAERSTCAPHLTATGPNTPPYSMPATYSQLAPCQCARPAPLHSFAHANVTCLPGLLSPLPSGTHRLGRPVRQHCVLKATPNSHLCNATSPPRPSFCLSPTGCRPCAWDVAYSNAPGRSFSTLPRDILAPWPPLPSPPFFILQPPLNPLTPTSTAARLYAASCPTPADSSPRVPPPHKGAPAGLCQEQHNHGKARSSPLAIPRPLRKGSARSWGTASHHLKCMRRNAAALACAPLVPTNTFPTAASVLHTHNASALVRTSMRRRLAEPAMYGAFHRIPGPHLTACDTPSTSYHCTYTPLPI